MYTASIPPTPPRPSIRVGNLAFTPNLGGFFFYPLNYCSRGGKSHVGSRDCSVSHVIYNKLML